MTTQGIPARWKTRFCAEVNCEVTTMTPARRDAATSSAQVAAAAPAGMVETTMSSSEPVTPRMISTAHSLSSARMTRPTVRDRPRRRPGRL